MKNETLLWAVIMIVSVFIASISQILLKISASTSHSGIMYEYFNIRVVIAYALLFLTTIITVLVLRYVPFYIAASVESLSQVFVYILGRIILKEHTSMRKNIGVLMIIVGILMVCA